ncbi:MlrC C-terminus superfamily protein [Penicillium alfredii]|uniref:MlrC C-terminus superfamily protein n=1 Tax=Penicillium alfredii TaxID=1506179 RepID=A0A9W9FM45_9EURO|nr:MlrC C-terminus superfamily protein [Penicillium alfredii]KAJ5102440.1 MlrC C-terminus superfamily protein [Penicillium alfredii]
MPERPIIAIAGLACETSVFTPARTLAAAFHPRRATEIIDKYAFLHPGTSLGDAADWRGALVGHALPGGIVTRASFEQLANEMISHLAEMATSTTIHGLWYNIHGAMCVEGIDDAEAELLHRIRAVIGPRVLVSASLDLHGDVSRALAHQTDLITCYRMAPHEDEKETEERACRNLVTLLTARPHDPARPLKAWSPIPVLLPGEQTSTRIEPAKSLYALVPEIESTQGVLDAAIWVGYTWADEPRNHAVVVVTGWDKDTVTKSAKRLAQYFWDARGGFHFVAPTGSFTECIDAGLVSKTRPFFISDSGDNPTAGGSGDVTWGLSQLLSRSDLQVDNGPTVIYASIPGPQAIDQIVQAGVGATVTVTAGAEVDNLHSGPITMTGRVHSIRYGDLHAVIEAVLHTGSVFAIITKLRKPYHHEDDFTKLDLQPRSADIVIVKIGYLEPELFAMAADWMLALTPGGVDQQLKRLGHKRIHRPMWPFDKEFPKSPDLTPQLIPLSDEALG